MTQCRDLPGRFRGAGTRRIGSLIIYITTILLSDDISCWLQSMRGGGHSLRTFSWWCEGCQSILLILSRRKHRVLISVKKKVQVLGPWETVTVKNTLLGISKKTSDQAECQLYKFYIDIEPALGKPAKYFNLQVYVSFWLTLMWTFKPLQSINNVHINLVLSTI